MKTQHQKIGLMPALKRQSKKQLIIEAWRAGRRDIWQIAEDLGTQPSYIASTLQSHGLISGYYDLYTTPPNPLNIYFSEFQGKMGFRDLKASLYSVHVLNEVYKKFEEHHDRAGQHHCLVTALTMYNRARFSNKIEEAKVFKRWIVEHLTETSRNFN
jgi:hypothetical protein